MENKVSHPTKRQIANDQYMIELRDALLEDPDFSNISNEDLINLIQHLEAVIWKNLNMLKQKL